MTNVTLLGCRCFFEGRTMHVAAECSEHAPARLAELEDRLADREEARDLWDAGIKAGAHPRILANLEARFVAAREAFDDEDEEELLRLEA